jgi:hypothetical protein
MIPFLTDDEIAERLRAVEAKLRELGLLDLAAEAADIARILDPEPTT